MIWILLAQATWTPPPCPRGLSDLPCAQRESARLDKHLAEEMTRAITRLRTCRPANSTACFDRAGAQRVVLAEQRAWKSWRDAHCDVMAFAMNGSSGEGIVRADCRSKMTAERIDTIKKIGRR